MLALIDIVISGLLLGGIYALIAMGLSLQYGVAQVLNIAHGEFIMFGAFLSWSLYTVFNLSPLISLSIIGPILFITGFVLYNILFTRLKISSPTTAAYEGNSMLACFGLLFIIQNIAILIWGADIKGYSYFNFSVNILGAVFAANRLLTLCFSLVICSVFYFFLTHTRLGKAIRAAAQNPTAAGLMGVNIKHVLALCFAFGSLMAGLGGGLISMSYQIQPTMGLEFTMIALIVIVLGGIGNILGSLIGGILLGLVGSIVTYTEPGLVMVAYYSIFMILLLAKPTGILGKKA
jgi:branched-chain amino acid transport system permease protein